MAITKTDLNLDNAAMAKLHTQLARTLLGMLDDPENAANPKFIANVIQFLNNNDINCSPTVGAPATNDFKGILEQMTLVAEEEDAA